MADDDSVLKVGAIFDLSQLLPAFDTAAGGAESMANKVKASFSGLASLTLANVSPESLSQITSLNARIGELGAKETSLKSAVAESKQEIDAAGGAMNVSKKYAENYALEQLALKANSLELAANEKLLKEALLATVQATVQATIAARNLGAERAGIPVLPEKAPQGIQQIAPRAAQAVAPPTALLAANAEVAASNERVALTAKARQAAELELAAAEKDLAALAQPIASKSGKTVPASEAQKEQAERRVAEAQAAVTQTTREETAANDALIVSNERLAAIKRTPQVSAPQAAAPQQAAAPGVQALALSNLQTSPETQAELINLSARVQELKQEEAAAALKVKATGDEIKATGEKAGGSSPLFARLVQEEVALAASSAELALKERELQQAIQRTIAESLEAAEAARKLRAEREKAPVLPALGSSPAVQQLSAQRAENVAPQTQEEAAAADALAAANKNLASSEDLVAASTATESTTLETDVAVMARKKAIATELEASGRARVELESELAGVTSLSAEQENRLEAVLQRQTKARAASDAEIAKSSASYKTLTTAKTSADAQAASSLTTVANATSVAVSKNQQYAESFLQSKMSVQESVSALMQLGRTEFEATEATNAAARAMGLLGSESEVAATGLKDVSIAAEKATVDFAQTRIELQATSTIFGFRLPRAIVSLLAHVKGIQPIIQGAFAVAAPLLMLEMMGRLVEKMHEFSDEVEGNTKAVKKMFEEDVKASTAAMSHASSLAEAYRNLGEHTRAAGALSELTWKDKITRNIEDAKRTQSSFWELMPGGVAAVHNLAQAWDAVTKGAADAKNQEIQALEAAERDKHVINELHAAATEQKVKEAEWTSSTRTLGMTRVQALRDEINHLKEIGELKATEAGQKAAEKPGANQGDSLAAANKVREETAYELVNKQRRLGLESLSESIRIETARTEAEKSETQSYLNFYEAGLHRMLADEKITAQAAEEAEIASLNVRLEGDKQYAAKRKKELQEEAATGKNTKPEEIAIDTHLKDQEIKTAQDIQSVKSKYLDDEQAHANAVSLAINEAALSGAEETANFEEQKAREALAAKKITIDQEATILKSANEKVFTDKRLVLQEELRIESEHQHKNAAQIEAINQKLANLKVQEAAKNDAIDSAATEKKIAEAKRVQEEESRFAVSHSELLLQIARQEDNDRLKGHEISLSQWGADEKAALGKWYDEQHSVFQKAIDDEAALHGKGTVEYRKALDEMIKLKLKFKLESDKIDDQLAAKFEATMKVVSTSFNSAFDKMLSEHIKFGKVLQTFWNEMVRGWGRMGLQIVADYTQHLAQIVVQHALSLLKIQVIDNNSMTIGKATKLIWESFLDALGIKHVSSKVKEEGAKAGVDKTAQATSTTQTTIAEAAKTLAVTQGVSERTLAVTGGEAEASTAVSTATVTQILSLAGRAGAAGFASVMEALPFPANVATAPGVMTEAIGTTLSNLSLGTAMKGALLDKDQLVAAHATEMILPPPISMGLQNVIKHGSIGAPQSLGASPKAANSSSSTSSSKQTTHNHRWNIDARGGNEKQLVALFDKQLIPKIRKAFRDGEFD
jgi:hypothetical protein